MNRTVPGAPARFLLVPALALVLLPAPTSAQFVEVTSSTIADTGDGFAVAWGDYDGNDRLDMFLARYGGGERLFRNVGGTSFQDVTPPLLGVPAFSRGAVWGDIDGDGDIDLYVVHEGSENDLFLNNGATWNVLYDASRIGGDSRAAAFGDFDIDGDLDLFVVNSGSANAYLRNDGGTFVNATTGPLGRVGSGRAVATGDYDGDGDLDIYVVYGNGEADQLLRNDGYAWTDVTAAPLGGASDGTGAGFGDYDDDGDLDLYVANLGVNQLFRNDGGSWTDVATKPVNVDLPSRGASWVDYDNDGDLDLFVVNGGGTGSQLRNALVRNDGGVWTDVTPAVLGTLQTTTGAGWADYDDDGDMDVYVVNSNVANNLYRNDTPAAPNSVRIIPVGLAPNTGGVGARVRVVAGSNVWIREVTSASGSGSQGPNGVHFGIGSVTVIDSVIVRWPDGTRQLVDPTPKPDSITKVYEPQDFAITGQMQDSGTAGGAAWLDYDGDGDLDLYQLNYSSVGNLGTNRLYRNDAGVFVDVTTEPLANRRGSAGVTVGDFDGDGDVDMYVGNSGEANRLLRNDGGGVWTASSDGVLGDTGTAPQVISADVDLDGDLDLFVVNRTSLNKLLRNDGASGWTDATPALLAQQNQFFTNNSAAFADMDDDGDPDLLLNCGQFNRLFRNDGGNTWTDVTPSAILTHEYTTMIAWSDYDNDGDLDVYLGGSYPDRLIRNDGGNTWTDVTASALPADGTRAGRVAWLDFDNDGWLDIYLNNVTQSESRLLRNHGGWFSDVASGPLLDRSLGAGAAVGDYDGDGDVDLYVTNSVGPELGLPGFNFLVRNESLAPHHWVQLDLRGTLSNRSAIGARVRVVTGDLSQIREIGGGVNGCAQDALLASFGLGGASAIDSVIIRWPSGLTHVVDPVPAIDQRVTIVEPTTVSVDAPASSARGPQSVVAVPNPFNPSTEIRFEIPRPSHVTLNIYDVAGRHVRRLIDARSDAGRHAVTWRGRTDDGSPVVSGVYFARVEVEGVVRSTRLTLVK